MNIILNLQRHYSEDVKYRFDEDAHRAEFGVSESFQFMGFLISTMDHENFYVRTEMIDGTKQPLFCDVLHRDYVRIFDDPTELTQTAQSIAGTVSICACYRHKDGEQIRSIQLPCVVEANVNHQGVGVRKKPLNLLPNIPSFEWETDLITDEDNFLNKSYTHIKALMAAKNYALDVPVLIGLLRIYKGNAIDFLIYDLIKQTSDIEILKAVLDTDLGQKHIRLYLVECIQALESGSTRPEHPLVELLPHLQDGVYITLSTIHIAAKSLIDCIKENLKFSLGRYSAKVDLPCAVLGYGGLLLSTNADAPQTHYIKQLCQSIESGLNPKTIFKQDPQIVISQITRIMRLAADAMEDFELDLMSKTGFTYAFKNQRIEIRSKINELLQVIDNLHVERMHLQTQLPSPRQLGVAKMNLRNMQAKLEKFDKALNSGKIKLKDYELKTSSLKEKISSLDQSIKESESDVVGQIELDLKQIALKLNTNTEQLESLNLQLQQVPHNHEYTKLIRESFGSV